jgi:single-strand DNA-binding protein
VLNRVILIGNLTKDPELRYTSNGTAVATFTLAVNRNYANQQGEREADFIPVVVWRQLAELCANYLKKGRKAAVEGRIQTRSYENQEGKRVYVTEVVAENVQFLDSNRENRSDYGQGIPFDAPNVPGGNNRQFDQRNKTFAPDPFAGESETIDISDDDLPF